MTDELVTRLRNLGINLADRAADRIESDAATIARLEGEIKALTTAGIIEVAVRNPSVADYVQHWEGRAEAAEAKGDTEIPADAENGRATVSRIKKGDVSQSSAD